MELAAVAVIAAAAPAARFMSGGTEAASFAVVAPARAVLGLRLKGPTGSLRFMV